MSIVEAAPSRFSLIRPWSIWRRLGFKTVAGSLMLCLVIIVALLAPIIAPVDPTAIDPSNRNRPAGYTVSQRDDDGVLSERVALLGTDSLGRDLFSRVIHGSRISLIVGLSVAMLAVVVGTVIGLVAGYVRWLDGPVMRVMDGLMAIPNILLALTLVSLIGASLWAVILAVMLVDIPRVVRLVRSIVLSVREEPYVEAAVALGSKTPKVLRRHVLLNTFAPLLVQATFLASAAILLESGLSFLGVGLPPEIPTWGNVIASGRSTFQVYPQIILYPALFLSFTVLAINMLGDGLRDTLDPRLAKRI